jgi:hypothetical protein
MYIRIDAWMCIHLYESVFIVIKISKSNVYCVEVILLFNF